MNHTDEYNSLRYKLIELCKDILMIDAQGFMAHARAAQVALMVKPPEGFSKEMEEIEALKVVACAVILLQREAEKLRKIMVKDHEHLKDVSQLFK